jgi:hypothetical protein
MNAPKVGRFVARVIQKWKVTIFCSKMTKYKPKIEKADSNFIYFRHLREK